MHTNSVKTKSSVMLPKYKYVEPLQTTLKSIHIYTSVFYKCEHILKQLNDANKNYVNFHLLLFSTGCWFIY